MRSTPIAFRLSVGLAAVLLLTACAAGPTDPADPARTSEATSPPEATLPAEQAGFPRTIDVPAGADQPATTLTLETEPTRIAALTYETGELVANLGAMDRLVLVQQALTSPVLSGHAQAMGEVAHHAATEGSIDAEAVIAADPDLVLISARRGLEEGVAQVLDGAGIPVLVLPNHWATLEDLTDNIDLVGEALGLEQAAADLAGELSKGLHSPPGGSGDTGAPRVLVLSNQAGQPFVTAGAAFPLEVLRVAGGRDAGERLDLTRSGPISAEQVLSSDPDGILLVDMNGSGDRVFEPLLTNAAVAELPAVSAERVHLIEGRKVQAMGFTAAIEGRAELEGWLAREVAPGIAD